MTHPSGIERKHPGWVKAACRADGGGISDGDVTVTSDDTDTENEPLMQHSEKMPYAMGHGDPVFNVDPKKDNLVSGAAKIMAEPAAETVRDLYHRIKGN